jgi:uncharacterized protein (TIGR00369 family)
LEDVQQHADKTVHGVGVLAIGGLKRIWAKCIERTEGQRVAIDEQQSRLFCSVHAGKPSLNHPPFLECQNMNEPILSPQAAELWKDRQMGALADRMGIKLLELSAERAVATMPVEGNTQPLGLVHGGAYVVLGESLGSFAANVWAAPNGYAVGIEVNASHSGSATSGTVTAVCTALNLGKTLTLHEIVVTDEAGRRLSTVRITNLIRSR